MSLVTDNSVHSGELGERKGRVLGAILLTLLVVLTIVIVAGMFGTTTRIENLVLYALFAYTALLYALHRRGHFALCMHGVVFGLIVFGALESAVYGSIRGAGTFAQIAALTCGGVFLGRNALIAAGALSAVTIAGLVHAQIAGWLPTPNLTITYSHAVIYSVIILAVALMIYYSHDLLEHIIKRLAGELLERQKAEATLRRNEERMTKLFRSSPAALAITTLKEGRIIEINDACERIFATRRDPIIGKAILELGLWVDTEDRERFLAQLSESGRVRDFSARLQRQNGEVFEALIAGELLSGEREPEILSTIVDLSSEIEAREALKKSEKRFLSAFRLSPLAMTIVRMSDRRFVELNDANEKLIGYRREELIGRNPDEIGFWADQSGRQRYAAALREHGEVRAFDTRMFRRDGGTAEVRIWSTLIDMAGEPCVLSTLVNVTDELLAQRRVHELALSLEQRVAERTTELEAANKELESFGYSVSHDLRAPLRAMAGFSSILLEDCRDSLNADALGHATRIHAAAVRMGSLIDNLLRLSQIDRTELNRTDFSLSDLASRVAASLAEANPGREVKSVVQPQMQVNGDRNLISHVIENLLGNAWKFTAHTDSARVEIGCEPGDHQTVYFVRDNGAGFDMRYADKLFKVFQRLHRAEEFEGTGVGLSIAQRIVRRHGGKIWAEGETGRGATFYFTLGGAIHGNIPAADSAQ